MYYTYEQIKNFTPTERNAFLDFIISLITANNKRVGICYFLHQNTYIYNCFSTTKVLSELFGILDIPIIREFHYSWFKTNDERISFLKALKTAE